MPTYADIRAEELHFRATEPYRNEKAYTLKALVPDGTTRQAWLQIADPGGFLLLAISGGVRGPTRQALQERDTTFGTQFQMAGTTTGFAERGVSLKITDLSNGKNRELTLERNNLNAGSALFHSFIPLENLLCPGYGFFPQPFRPQPFRYFLPVNTLWRFDLRNLDAETVGDPPDDARHRVMIALLGRRYAV